ncbi:MAG: type III-A CRISPR-associated protein Cas10/Csm1 [Chloroflexota bacterium]
MEGKVLFAAIAGMLHDVGKFALRAGVEISREWDDGAKRDYKHKHALHTWDFIEAFLPTKIKEKVKTPASSHHRPASREDYVIALADRLSAGERADDLEDDRKVHPRQLLSIFSILQADGITPSKDNWKYWPLQALSLDEKTKSTDFFPAKALSDDSVWKAYEKMWEIFREQAGVLKKAHESGGDIETYLETLLSLMQQYTWCIPSAYYQSRPDISLFDHSRMTAALAAILTDSQLSENEIKTLAENPEKSVKRVALLVGGDISGVQDFIYTITSRGATSALRGRSFYLQLLTEVVARYILSWVGLPITNLIYAGGGNFYLLARPSDLNELPKIQQAISRILYKHHQGDLYVAIAGLPLQANDFVKVENGKHVLSKKWDDLIKELQVVKQHRFAELPESDLEVLFAPQGHGGNEDIECKVCGREHPGTKVWDKPPEGQEGVKKCPPCHRYEEELGKDLREANYLVWDYLKRTDPPKKLDAKFDTQGWRQALNDFGFDVHLLKTLTRLAQAENRRIILALTDGALEVLTPNVSTAVGRRFLVNVTPLVIKNDVKEFTERLDEEIKSGDIKPFDLLQLQSRGIKRLGVLRMDVDDLGKLFAEGLGSNATLSRIASLSFAVSLYFEGWVGVLAEKRNKKNGDRLYSIYSGGDDLFFVGSWDEIVELAREIRADLTEYAAGHPGIHASAGIVLVGGKYPLAQAAEDAAEAEIKAKRHEWWDASANKTRKKDVISFLGQPIHWQRFGLNACDQGEFENAHALMHFLVKVVQQDEGNHSLLRLLIRLYQRYQEADEKRRVHGFDQNRSGQSQPLWGPWNWLVFYNLHRMARREERENKELSQKLRELADILRNDILMMEWLGLAARWAEIFTRKTSND